MYARAPRCTGCLPEILATARGHGARLCLIDTAPHAESPALEAHDFEPVRPGPKRQPRLYWRASPETPKPTSGLFHTT